MNKPATILSGLAATAALGLALREIHRQKTAKPDTETQRRKPGGRARLLEKLKQAVGPPPREQ